MHGIERHGFVAIIGVFVFFLAVSTISVAAEPANSTLAVPGNRAWVNSGISVSVGDRVAISANGTVSVGCSSCPDAQGPAGQPVRRLAADGRPFAAPGLRLWSLVGKIGSSQPFEIGAETEFVAPRGGVLKLSVNDNSFAENSGQWAVTVSVTRASPQLFVLSPFHLGASDLTNLDLSVLLPSVDFTAAQAVGLLADDTATAIVLWQTKTRSAVTFTVNNGTTLQPYQADFLTKAPAAGAKKLTVAGSDLIKVGNKFYAAALVQAPARGAKSSFSQQIVVTASQDGVTTTPAEAFLDLKIPPVILIHGLWGDRHSLDSTRDYLSEHPPWQKDTQLLSRIEYPLDLRFDDATTSAIVADAIESVLGILDSEKIVGGRVDAVAHSMGGLVARYYSSLSLYRAPRDREQGQFHAVTTLDTPQLGSALATFLIDHRNDHEQAPGFSEPAGVWLAICQSFSVTVAKCFDDNDMPILGPDGEVRGGAVWSVAPGSKSLKNAPALPSIAGVIWADITSVVRDKDDSTLRYVISNLIKAIYSDPGDAPSPTDILGGPNDVIVDFRSQSKGSTDANRIKFLGLDHSALRFDDFTITDAVNNSGKVNESVACWFKTDGGSSCIPSGPVPGVANAAVSTARVIPRKVDQLVQLPQTAQVGVPMAVTGSVKARGVSRVAVHQRNDEGKSAAPAAEEAIPFKFSGNSLSFEITPQLPGWVTFDINVTLADGSKLAQRVTRNVTIRDDTVEKFHGHRTPRAFLFMQLGAGLPLAPYGVFRNIEEDVPLNGQVQYSVASAENPPVVRIEGETLVPLRPGAARVLARLGSKTDVVRVTVKP
jgi:pimeloyl-ACP methyl ester carboxylesterase